MAPLWRAPLTSNHKSGGGAVASVPRKAFSSWPVVLKNLDEVLLRQQCHKKLLGPGRYWNDQSHAYQGSDCIPLSRQFHECYCGTSGYIQHEVILTLLELVPQNAFRSWPVLERSTTRVSRVWLYSAIAPEITKSSKRT